MKQQLKELTVDQAKKLNLSAFNRRIVTSHVASLMTEMCNDFNSFGPITISNRNVIIDGAHRRQAFVNCVEQGKIPAKSKLLVRVIEVSPEEERNLIMKCNTKAKSWILSDYIQSNINAGNKSLERLVEWCSDKELCINEKRKTDRIKYSYGSSFICGKRNDDALKNNTFEISDEDIALGTEIYNEIDTLRKILNWPAKTIRYDYWAIVWREIRNRHSMKDWKKAFKENARRIQRENPQTIRAFDSFLSVLDSHIGRDKDKKIRTATEA